MTESSEDASKRPANVRDLRAMFEGGGVKGKSGTRSRPSIDASRTVTTGEKWPKPVAETLELGNKNGPNEPGLDKDASSLVRASSSGEHITQPREQVTIPPEEAAAHRAATAPADADSNADTKNASHQDTKTTPQLKPKPTLKPKPDVRPKPAVKPKPAMTWPPADTTPTPESSAAEPSETINTREVEAKSPEKESGSNVGSSASSPARVTAQNTSEASLPIPQDGSDTTKPSLPMHTKRVAGVSNKKPPPPVRPKPGREADTSSDTQVPMADLIDLEQGSASAKEPTEPSKCRPAAVAPHPKPEGVKNKPALPLRPGSREDTTSLPSSSRAASPQTEEEAPRTASDASGATIGQSASAAERARRPAPTVPARSLSGSRASASAAARYLACFHAVADPTSDPPVVRPAAVRSVWTRSKLATTDLAEIWRSVSGSDAACAGLTQTQFVTGLGMIDAQLRVRRRPPAASRKAPPQLPQRPVES